MDSFGQYYCSIELFFSLPLSLFYTHSLLSLTPLHLISLSQHHTHSLSLSPFSFLLAHCLRLIQVKSAKIGIYLFAQKFNFIFWLQFREQNQKLGTLHRN